MAVVKAPNKQYNGISAGVQFKDGVGETTNPHLIEWFKLKGYLVEEPDPVPEVIPEAEIPAEETQEVKKPRTRKK